jgi:transposase
MTLVGLDVHKAQTVAAVLDPVTAELRVQRLRGEPERVVPVFLEELDRPLRAVYEAGPTGFVLARVAEERGLDVAVVAPGSIPRASGDRVKTDRRDARRLVRLFAAGELSFAFVPSEPDERFRDVVRCVEDARKDLMRARHRLSKFLLRRGVRSPCKSWTWAHEQWLAKVSFEEELSRAVFLDYLCAEQSLVQRRRALIGVLEGAVAQSSHAPAVERLRCFRGIDTLTAAGLCAEVGNFDRFEKPSLLSGFLGVVPREYTSVRRSEGRSRSVGHQTQTPTRPPPHDGACGANDAHETPDRPGASTAPAPWLRVFVPRFLSPRRSACVSTGASSHQAAEDSAGSRKPRDWLSQWEHPLPLAALSLGFPDFRCREYGSTSSSGASRRS